MSYFTVDDQMHSHDKTLELVGSALGRQALGLWTVAGSWCGGHPEAMGELSLKRIRALGFSEKHAETLESVRFWDKTPEGWCFHGWDAHRPNDKQLAKRRENTKERVRKHRGNKKRNALPDGVTEKDGNALPGPSVPYPSVPIHTVPDGNANGSGSQAWFSNDTIAEMFSSASVAAGRPKWTQKMSDYRRLEDCVKVLKDLSDRDVVGPASARAYFDHAEASLKRKGFPFWGWANDLEHWIHLARNPQSALGQTDITRGPAVARADTDYEAEAGDVGP